MSISIPFVALEYGLLNTTILHFHFSMDVSCEVHQPKGMFFLLNSIKNLLNKANSKKDWQKYYLLDSNSLNIIT